VDETRSNNLFRPEGCLNYAAITFSPNKHKMHAVQFRVTQPTLMTF